MRRANGVTLTYFIGGMAEKIRDMRQPLNGPLPPGRVTLQDDPGIDWEESPADLRVREVPDYRKIIVRQA